MQWKLKQYVIKLAIFCDLFFKFTKRNYVKKYKRFIKYTIIVKIQSIILHRSIEKQGQTAQRSELVALLASFDQKWSNRIETANVNSHQY